MVSCGRRWPAPGRCDVGSLADVISPSISAPVVVAARSAAPPNLTRQGDRTMKDLLMTAVVFAFAIIRALSEIDPAKLSANHNQTLLRG